MSYNKNNLNITIYLLFNQLKQEKFTTKSYYRYAKINIFLYLLLYINQIKRVPMQKNNPHFNIKTSIWTLFINGLLTILPLAITLSLINISFRFIISWFEPLKKIIEQTPFAHIPYAEIFFVIFGIFILGAILRVFILQALFNLFEKFIEKIPLVAQIYSGIKQLVHAFGMHDQMSFKRVVLIEFPRKGAYSIGFLTSEVPPQITPNSDEKFFNVFIPTTPNPTSGYFIMLAASEISIVDLTRHEAMALIISGGIIQPERFIKKKSIIDTD